MTTWLLSYQLMDSYNHKEIEPKWQQKWENDKSHLFNHTSINNKKYVLTMFSYPSGDKLHIGHWYNYGPVDTYSRYLKLQGYNVFQPQGFDAFGLPAENFAIKNGVHPAISTKQNISVMKSQLKKIGAMFNWDNEVITCQPDYYKWTQWLFLKLYEKDLAYQKKALVNWDPIDQTVLANEQVLPDGTSERSGGLVIQKPLKQWFFKITNYAEELLDFNNLAWPSKTISMQKNWIGKSVGAKLSFKLEKEDINIDIFTTRPDTLFGCTYLVLSPEFPDLLNFIDSEYKDSVSSYCNEVKNKNEKQRTDDRLEKTGVFTGLYALNPINNKTIPIWISDYVLMSYGTGAIMAVPGHDQRDYEFAKKYSIEILKVIDNGSNISLDDKAFTGNGYCVNSGFLNNLKTEDAIKTSIKWLKENRVGDKHITYRLKDWLISRQRYWGTPIPIVYDPDGNAHPIPSEYLPWELPNDVEYKPKGTSPLGSSKKLLERTEKIFGKGWTPEIDTMDTFVCSSWYYLRYPYTSNENLPFSNDSNNWLPVDHYIGGSEHATMHLLYARFITKCLKDLGQVDFDEPFTHLFHQGTITKDGSKMSKSKGNTVSPDSFVDKYGSDTFRCYLMFMGPYEDGGDWDDSGIKGVDRFLKRVYNLISSPELKKISSKDEYVDNFTIKSVTTSIESMKFNTAISKLMEFVNHFYDIGLTKQMKNNFMILLSPFAPHLCEEMWESTSHGNSIFNEKWPIFDDQKLILSTISLPIQVNGKLRGNIKVDTNLTKDKIFELAKVHKNVVSYIQDKTLLKEIYVPGKIINFVVK